jgi:hypothetical protein
LDLTTNGGNLAKLRERPKLVLLLIMIFAVIFRVSIIYPSNGLMLPSGYDAYIHAASAYFIAKGGLAASPTSPIYPPLFLILLAGLYVITGILPIYLIAPVGIAIDVLCLIPMYYIASRMSGRNSLVGLVAAFFASVNPITLSLLIMGTIPALLGVLEFLVIVAILVSDFRNRAIGIVLIGLSGGLIFLTNILLAVLYAFFVGLVFLYEIILKRGMNYSKPLFYSLFITAVPAILFYVPRLSYLFVGVLGGMEYVIWNIANFIVVPILCLPLIFLFKSAYTKKFTYARNQNLKLLRLWYLAAPVMALVFIWQADVLSRIWQLLCFPVVVVVAMIFVAKFKLMAKARSRRTAAVFTASILVICVVTTYPAGVLMFNSFYGMTPERVQLIGWIKNSTPQNAVFCTEEEFIPTMLGWYIMGLTGRMAYLSLSNFSAAFQLGTDVTLNMNLAHNITALTAGSTYWIDAIRALHVSYVILLVNETHSNYASISGSIVYTTSLHVVYNVTSFL